MLFWELSWVVMPDESVVPPFQWGIKYIHTASDGGFMEKLLHFGTWLHLRLTEAVHRFWVQVAHAAVKDKANPYYALKYERIAKRRGKKRAIIAIARMILTAIYSMFGTGEVWNPVDLYKVDMPEHLKEQQLAKAIKQAKRFLEKQGLSVA